MISVIEARWFICYCLLVAVAVSGFVPPPPSSSSLHDDADDTDSVAWETVDTMRQRLGIHYNFTPNLLNPEMCRFLSEEECRQADDALQAHAAKLKRLPEVKRQRARDRQRQLEEQSSSNTTTSSLRPSSATTNTNTTTTTTERQLNPSEGVVKILVILLQFTDHVDRPLIDPSVYDEIWNGNGKSDVIPSGSVSRWFQLNSYGLYEIEAVIVPWSLADNSEIYYSFGSSGLVPNFQQAFWPALDKLDQEGIDFSQYDADGDGVLDAVAVLHTGYSAELKGVDCNTDRDFANRIWSHAFADTLNSWWSMDGRFRVGAYMVSSAYRETCGFEPARIGTMTHEFLHTLSLVDLYDGQDARVGRGIGGYDIMATPYGPKDDPSWPGHLSAWSRIKVGWMNPIEITEDGEYSIQASELSNQAYVIRKPYPFMEYLLIENRQPLWFDSRLWTGGLVIYHIDDRAIRQTKRGYPGQEGWPRNGNHYQVAVLASDGQYNLEKGDNNGDVGDFWKEGMTLGPGNGRVFPNTDAYQFGSIRVTGVTIDNIKNIDTVMTFRVTGLTETVAPAPLPASTASTVPEAPSAVSGEFLPLEDEKEVWPTMVPFTDAVKNQTAASTSSDKPDTNEEAPRTPEGNASGGVAASNLSSYICVGSTFCALTMAGLLWP